MGILNDQFKGITPAQKTFVLSMLIDKIYKNPTDYGLNEDGILRVGDKLNFSKLFENGEEIKSIFAKAKETIIEGSPQEKSILENKKKISDWVENNPDVKLTPDNVSEILAAPKSEIEIPETLLPPEIPIVPNPNLQEQIENDIAGYKRQIQDLEVGKSREIGKEGMRSMMSDISAGQEVELAFRNDINNIYGLKGFFSKTPGVETKDWKFMKGLEANKVLKYFRDPENPDLQRDLPAKVLSELGTSTRHRNLMDHISFLNQKASQKITENGGTDDFKPYENGENIEAFIKRLGTFLMRQK